MPVKSIRKNITRRVPGCHNNSRHNNNRNRHFTDTASSFFTSVMLNWKWDTNDIKKLKSLVITQKTQSSIFHAIPKGTRTDEKLINKNILNVACNAGNDCYYLIRILGYRVLLVHFRLKDNN